MNCRRAGNSDEVPDWFLGMEEIDTSDAPDWFTAEEEEADAENMDWLAEQEAAGPSDSEMDDFFDSLDVSTPDAAQFERPMSFEDMFGAEDEEEEAGVVDPSLVPDGELLKALGIEGPEDEQPEWFGEEEEAEEDMSWLDDLGEMDEPALVSDETLDFTPPTRDEIEQPPEEVPDQVGELLASMEDVPLPDTGDLLAEDADFDTLFSDPAFSEIEPRVEEADEDELQPESPDWLTEAGATAGLSAAAMLRQRDDRPLDELSDRLKHLRERGQQIPTTEQDEAVTFLDEPALDTAAMGTSGIAASLTSAQQQHVDLLKQLTAGAGIQPRQATGAYTFEEDPFMLDEDETLPEALEVPAQPRPGLRQRIRFDRLLIMIVLFVLMMLPFVSNVRIGSPPPTAFPDGSRQQAVFQGIEHLAIGDPVLVGMEYGPTAAGELDSLARVLLQHILEREAVPVVVSSNPVALLRANNLLADLGAAGSPLLSTLGRSTPLQLDRDYYVTRYLSGNALGIRALSQNLGTLLATDYRGDPTGLRLNSLDDFVQILVIAEQPDDLRAWMEQVAPLTQVSIYGATGKVGEPLIQPYFGSGLDGLLVGYGDALTYSSLLGGPTRAQLFESTPSPTPLTPTLTPSPTLVYDTGVIRSDQDVNLRSAPSESAEIAATIRPGQAVTILDQNDDGSWLNISLPDGTSGWVFAALVAKDAVPVPSATSSPTNTPVPTDTPTRQPTTTALPSFTPIPSSTALPSATFTPSDTPTPTATERPTLPPTWTPGAQVQASPTISSIVRARVIANSSVNIRSGPGTTFAAVGAAQPGDTFDVIGRNEDGSWIQIDYPDLAEGQEAWIAAFLVDISVDQGEDSAYSPGQVVAMMAGPGAGMILMQAETPTVETAATQNSGGPTDCDSHPGPDAHANSADGSAGHRSKRRRALERDECGSAVHYPGDYSGRSRQHCAGHLAKGGIGGANRPVGQLRADLDDLQLHSGR